ncbi:MAG: hypothetical protein HRT61_17275 [Ekhidna sp.]|nr:hypothetical protein [Ekhidna sp.]
MKEEPEVAGVDSVAVKVVNRAIEVAGGMNLWISAKRLEFEKTSILYEEDGSMEDSSLQIIEFLFDPAFEARISKQTDRGEELIHYHNDSTFFFINDSLYDIDNENRKKSVMSALYTIGMPFKLLDAGTVLTYVGKDSVGMMCQVIQAEYAPEDNTNHSTNEIWWYYFDEKDGGLVAGKVYHEPTYALILNKSYDNPGGLTLPSYRHSFRVDSLGDIKFLRGEFYYEKFKVGY